MVARSFPGSAESDWRRSPPWFSCISVFCGLPSTFAFRADFSAGVVITGTVAPPCDALTPRENWMLMLPFFISVLVVSTSSCIAGLAICLTSASANWSDKLRLPHWRKSWKQLSRQRFHTGKQTWTTNPEFERVIVVRGITFVALHRSEEH